MSSAFQTKFEDYYNANMHTQMEALCSTYCPGNEPTFYEKASNLTYQKLMANPITSKCQVTCGPEQMENGNTVYKITITKRDNVWEKCCGCLD